MVCEFYHIKKPIVGWSFGIEPIYGLPFGACYKTIETEPCNCKGDKNYCDFCLVEKNEIQKENKNEL